MSRKLNEDYVLREIVGEFMLIPVKTDYKNQSGFIALNETAKLVLDGIINGKTDAEIAEVLCGEFNIDKESAENDTAEFIAEFTKLGIITE